MGVTTRTQIPAEVNNFYDRTLLERSLPALVHTMFAQTRDLPKNAGTNTIKFRKYGSLAANTTPLTEGVTPAGKQLSITDITATVLYYGDYITYSDVVTYESVDPILVEAADILGEQAGLSLDTICRDIINAGDTVQYAGAATQRSEVAVNMLISETEVKEGVLTLKRNNAPMVTSRIDPNSGYSTVPLNRCYVGFIHPNSTNDLATSANNWVPVEKYPNKSDLMPNEVGACGGVRFIESTNGKCFGAVGSSSAYVYSTVIMGRNAYAISRISGLAMQNIVKPLGSSGSADPLNQRGTTGWKAAFVAKILQQGWIVRIEHGVSVNQ